MHIHYKGMHRLQMSQKGHKQDICDEARQFQS